MAAFLFGDRHEAEEKRQGRKEVLKRGRPPFQWTVEIEEEILSRLASGDAVSTILGGDRDDFLPSEAAFYSRIAVDQDFFQRYMRAREAQAHRETDEIRRIADDATPEGVHVARLQIDARKWRAAKLAPKVYGDKLELAVTKPKTEEELDAAIAAKLAAMAASGQGGTS